MLDLEETFTTCYGSSETDSKMQNVLSQCPHTSICIREDINAPFQAKILS